MRTQHPTRTRMLLIDALLAMMVGSISAVASLGAWSGQQNRAHPDAVSFAIIGIAVAALILRRLYPFTTLIITATVIGTYYLVGYPYGPAIFSVIVAVYTVATLYPVKRSLIGLLIAAAGTSLEAIPEAVSERLNGGHIYLLWILTGFAWLIGPWAIGTIMRLKRESALREQEETEREKLHAERLHIAQEVHDVVGHGLAAINMQAQVGLHVFDKHPEKGKQALTAIHTASSDALHELRHTLTVIGAEEHYRPASTLAELDTLFERMRASSVEITLHTTGNSTTLPPAIDRAAYRIVQESLTNVLKHAAPTRAEISLEYGTKTLTVEIYNEGTPLSHTHHSGRGIPGMRERATSLGGTLEAEPHTGGGFIVRAVLPREKETA